MTQSARHWRLYIRRMTGWYSRDARRGPIAQQMLPIANLAWRAVLVTPVSETTLMRLVPMAFMTIWAVDRERLSGLPS